MAIKSYSAFREPSPYEQESRRAEQQRRLAEMLQQQSMAEEDPYTFQGIRAMPSPAAALAKMLSAYGAKKATKAAEEAESKAKGMEEQTASQIAGRLMGGAPLSSANTVPDANGLAEVAVESQYRVAPEDAARLSMTPVGAAATRGNPMLAAMLARSMEKPEAEEFYAPTETANGLVQFGKRGGRRDTGLKTPEKAPEPTTTQRDYEFAQSQGYKGSFEDFRKSNAPVTKINLGDKGTALGQELYLKKIDSLEAPARSANRILSQVNSMDKATQKGTFTGSMAPTATGAAQFLDSFGIKVKPEILANTRSFQAASNQLVLDFMSANGGARGFTEKETAILQDAFPKIVDSPQARKQIADLLRNRALQDVEDYNFAIGEFNNTFPSVVTPYKPIDSEEIRYQRWRRSQGGR